MSEHFHLITPVGRPGNIQQVAASIALAFEDPDASYTWWWVQFNDEKLDQRCRDLLVENKSIRYLTGERVAGWHDIMVLFNIALTAIAEQDRTGWVWQVQDDNIVPPWSIEKWCNAIAANPGKRVFVCCHDRGDHGTRHGASPLIARPENMNVGGVSLEQYLIQAAAHRDFKYVNSACGDGVLMADMYRACPEDFVFLTDFYVPFNALETGRWNPEHLSWFTTWTATNPRRKRG